MQEGVGAITEQAVGVAEVIGRRACIFVVAESYVGVVVVCVDVVFVDVVVVVCVVFVCVKVFVVFVDVVFVVVCVDVVFVVVCFDVSIGFIFSSHFSITILSNFV